MNTNLRTSSKPFIYVLIAVFALTMAAAYLAAPLNGYRPAEASSGCSTKGTATVRWDNMKTYQTETLGKFPYFQTLKANGNNQQSIGQCVHALQVALNARCKSGTGKLATDGKFGPHTERVVKRWQQMVKNKLYHVDNANISVDGIAGKQTWSTLRGIKPPYPYDLINCS